MLSRGSVATACADPQTHVPFFCATIRQCFATCIAALSLLSALSDVPSTFETTNWSGHGTHHDLVALRVLLVVLALKLDGDADLVI